jgi:hypothetical protein
MSSKQLAAGESESPVAESEVSKERGKHEEDNLVPGETTKKQAARSGTFLSPALVSHLHPHPHPISYRSINSSK